MRRFNTGPTAWIAQFVSGVPIVGSFSQGRAPPPLPCVEKLRTRPGLYDSVGDSASARFRHRTRAKPIASSDFRADATKQVDPGRLGQPQLLEALGRLVDSPSRLINPVFRLLLLRSDNVRSIDDLKHGAPNKFRVIVSPLSPPLGIV